MLVVALVSLRPVLAPVPVVGGALELVAAELVELPLLLAAVVGFTLELEFDAETVPAVDVEVPREVVLLSSPVVVLVFVEPRSVVPHATSAQAAVKRSDERTITVEASERGRNIGADKIGVELAGTKRPLLPRESGCRKGAIFLATAVRGWMRGYNRWE